MSDRLKSTHNVSNEEVIEDLTKDLELSLRSGDEENVVNPTTREEDFVASGGDSFRESQSSRSILLFIDTLPRLLCFDYCF